MMVVKAYSHRRLFLDRFHKFYTRCTSKSMTGWCLRLHQVASNSDDLVVTSVTVLRCRTAARTTASALFAIDHDLRFTILIPLVISLTKPTLGLSPGFSFSLGQFWRWRNYFF